MQMPTHEQIASLAYQLWQQRGCTDGSPEVDWERAMRVLEQPPEGDNAIVGFADARARATADMKGEAAEAQPLPAEGTARKPARRTS